MFTLNGVSNSITASRRDSLFINCLISSLVKNFPRSRSRSRRVFGRRDFYLAAISAEISPLISARFWSPRFSSRRDLGQKRAEISGEISAAKNAPRSRQISTAKNAPRLVARSRRDDNLGGQKRAEISPNLGGQKRAEISDEISAR